MREPGESRGLVDRVAQQFLDTSKRRIRESAIHEFEDEGRESQIGGIGEGPKALRQFRITNFLSQKLKGGPAQVAI